MGFGKSKMSALCLLFWTLATCLLLSDTKVKAQVPALCSLPSETGLCRAAFRRFFYNSTSQQCERFLYGGCQGNDNNFQTRAQCQAACACNQPLEMGQWKTGGRWCRWSMPSYYDPTESVCKKFLYWGCGGNSNRFSSKKQCNSVCAASRCYASRQTRMCRTGSQRTPLRFFHNTTSHACERFPYSGCNLKSENQFSSKRACERLCLQ